jgi:hypothetical protein
LLLTRLCRQMEVYMRRKRLEESERETEERLEERETE